MVAVDLTAPPFRLDAADVAWVEATLAAMTPDERIAQLFVLISRGSPRSSSPHSSG